MLQGKTIKIGGGEVGVNLPLSDEVEMEVAGTVLVSEFLEESDLTDFLSCKSNLRLNHDLAAEFSTSMSRLDPRNCYASSLMP